jgi:hypothetical protein
MDKNSKGRMMANESLTLWSPKEIEVIPSGISAPSEIINYAIQLSSRDKNQIRHGFENQAYEMTMSYVWTKAMVALKRDLAKVGMSFLGELLGKGDFDDDTNPTTAISDTEAVMIAQQLGVVSATESMRLRHAYEQISHFLDVDGNDIDENESMEEAEAVSGLKACVKNILGKQKVEVSTQFASFRSALEKKVFNANDSEVQNLAISPYFFRKITLGILLNLARQTKGAQLENALANLNVILPLVWPNIRDTEKFLVGTAYSIAYSDGAQTASAGLKSALLKVNGFDYVPETVRSRTFLKAAEKIIEAHEAMNNFYNEPAPVRELKALGSTIPIPAFPSCASAILCVKIGNSYGVSTAAQADANTILKAFTNERWTHYLNECLPTNARLLDKLIFDNQRTRFMQIAKQYSLNDLVLDGRPKRLIEAAVSGNSAKFNTALELIRKDYYGR